MPDEKEMFNCDSVVIMAVSGNRGGRAREGGSVEAASTWADSDAPKIRDASRCILIDGWGFKAGFRIVIILMDTGGAKARTVFQLPISYF